MSLKGNIIDATYVQSQDPTKTQPTQSDLATAALQAMNSSQTDAMTLVNSYKEEYGLGISTLVMIYNATGTALNLRSSDDDSGHIGKYPYDAVIQNGQWSVFLHVHTSGSAAGSIGAVGYTIQDDTGKVAVIAWNNPYNSSASAFADVWSSSGFHATSWDQVFDLASDGGTTGHGDADGRKYGYAAPYTMGGTSSPLYQVTVKKTS